MQPTVMEEGSKRFSLRYVGPRFDNKRLPLDVLSDLPALRDLIAALAKQEFRRNNPDRVRVPQGYDRSIAFSLVDFRHGSAVPVISYDNEVAQQNLPNIGDTMGDVVERAFFRVAEIFDDAAHDKFPQVLPLDAIRALSKLGANIQEDERIEFQGTTGIDGAVVCLDAFKRKKLLTKISETYTAQFDGVGTLTGVDSTHNFIQVRTEKYGELRLLLDGVSMPAKQFDGNIDELVEFSVSVALDAHDEFKSVKEVHSVDLVRPYDGAVLKCVQRLQELSKIEKGWLGEDQGERLVHLAAMRATQLIFMRAGLASQFRIFPTEEGGVSIEFDISDWNFAVEVMTDGSLEIDGSSADGDTFAARTFGEVSSEFLEAFDKMVLAASNG